MPCLQKEKKNVEEELKRLVADEIRREPLICEKREQLQKLSHEFMDTGIEYLFKASTEADQQPDDPAASSSGLSDPPTTSEGEPSSHAAAKRTKGKEVEINDAEDVPSEATRSSPLPGKDRITIQDSISDVEMEDGDGNDVEAMEMDDQPPDETPWLSLDQSSLTVVDGRVLDGNGGCDMYYQSNKYGK
ncbi:uncharacterized protein BKA55DRAFT_546028 [Fusarium redolens]|uniref:Uncharacterized protein n=1 Tax=Fusarium redolens TaxID=48865 RepID=A0A9P9JR06_FUSRE|nr:uncharacterized protein BKA55DRAFT_546028 [Fusarium redolens]KAH7222516.1 hypothetical protein BKA55DRAFT_546028 [Fusarium redolens]